MGGSGSGGSNKKATRVLQFEGNPGKRALNENEPEPKPRTRTPSPPRQMGAAGKKEWRRICRDLIDLGILTDLDLTILTLYCNTFDRWIRAEQQLVSSSNAEVILTSNGNLVKSPWLQISDKALDQLARLSRELGLTPVARSRISVEPLPDSGDDFLFGRGS